MERKNRRRRDSPTRSDWELHHDHHHTFGTSKSGIGIQTWLTLHCILPVHQEAVSDTPHPVRHRHYSRTSVKQSRLFHVFLVEWTECEGTGIQTGWDHRQISRLECVSLQPFSHLQVLVAAMAIQNICVEKHSVHHQIKHHRCYHHTTWICGPRLVCSSEWAVRGRKNALKNE